MDETKFFIVGANGQLGTALRKKYPKARYVGVDKLDITNRALVESFNWSGIEVLLNAAAYTDVDGAEAAYGRVAAWKVNATAVANLATVATQKGIILVHISTDYVFDGTRSPHTEDEPFSPLNVYGASKAAGDLVVSLLPKFYILRTSWLIGEGKNFVSTMLELGRKGVEPTVVADQIGRLTFTSELVRATDHLLTTKAQFGIYNVSNSGEPASWADISRKIFEYAELNLRVTDTSTAKYCSDKAGIATRPPQSTLDLTRLESIGLRTHNWQDNLKEYIEKEIAK